MERLHRIAAANHLSLDEWLWMLEQQTVGPRLDLPSTASRHTSHPFAAAPTRYTEQKVVGVGGMGTVRRVLDPDLQRTVARKELDAGATNQARARFIREARATAELQHPGVVPVHEIGELPDGRLYYTMREIEGRTLGAVIREAHAADDPDPGRVLRRLVEIFRRVCDTVAFAHQRGVVHRDLKPDNVMVGGFGEVLVVDWGLVKRVAGEPDSTDGVEGTVLGTPAYMPPEQAAGRIGAIGPRSDVYSLGAILYHIICGSPPYVGRAYAVLAEVERGPPPALASLRTLGGLPVPDELASLCAVALSREPTDRPSDAEAMSRAVAAWLEGAQRRARALEQVARADTLAAELTTMKARIGELRAEADMHLSRILPHAPVATKCVGWGLEDAAAAAAHEAALVELEYVQRLQAALYLDPDLIEAHDRLADHHHRAHAAAEKSRDRTAAARAEVLLRAHDRGRYTAWLAGDGALSLSTQPPGAEVHARRYESRERRLVPGDAVLLGHTPISGARIAAGSYLLELRLPGHQTLRCPVVVTRGAHWRATPPAAGSPASPTALAMAPAEGWDARDRYVPAGECRIGGDDAAPDGLSARQIWVDGFVMRQHPVTQGELLEFLNALIDTGRTDEAVLHAPKPETTAAQARPAQYIREDSGRFSLGVEHETDAPAVLVSWHTARAYAAWLGARDGLPWRLPDDLEWEKAARGVDGRCFPWGDHFEPTWTRGIEGQAGVAGVGPVGAHPEDESVYGVRDLGGNVRDWCESPYRRMGTVADGGRLLPGRDEDDAPLRTIRGGAYVSRADLCRAAARFAGHPEQVFSTVGIRLARTWPRRED